MIYDSLLARGTIGQVRMLPLVKFPHLPFVNRGSVGRGSCRAAVPSILIRLGRSLALPGSWSLRMAFGPRPLSTLALLAFGGGAIEDFAMVFLSGAVAGTWSSLMFASPIVLWWHGGQRPRIGDQFEVEPFGSAPIALAAAEA